MAFRRYRTTVDVLHTAGVVDMGSVAGETFNPAKPPRKHPELCIHE